MAQDLRLEHLRFDSVGEDPPSGVEAEGDFGASRGSFLRNGVLACVALGGVAAARREQAVAAPSPAQDRRILRFLLQLEYLQADFYSAASGVGRLRGELAEFADVVGAHEREHVALLERRLGRSTGGRPRFEFGDATANANRFARAARRLEENGVAAYIGQGANLTRRSVLIVSRITAVEARHAAWIADFLGRNPAPLAADKAKTTKQVLTSIRKTGFVR